MPRAPRIHRPYVAKCPKYNSRGKSATNRQRRRALHTGSKAWKQQRARVLIRDLFVCQACGHYGDQVDHIKGNAHEDVSDDELQTLCLPCHSSKTMTEQNEARR